MKKDAVKKKRIEENTPQYRYFPEETQEKEAAAFFHELSRRLLLSAGDKNALVGDFEKALRYLAAEGVSVSEALERLNPKNLGGFYSRPSGEWFALDNAAKIYPLSMKHGYMAVFRLSATLKEAVVPEILQMALNFTIGRFRSFATTVKKGIFWHYLEVTKRRYLAEQETGIPCSPIFIGRSGSQSFRVLYYERRISVEFFHVLTDGTGGMIFLKTLLAEYFRLLRGTKCTGEGILSVNAIPSAEETENAFQRVVDCSKASGFVDKMAVQLGGRLSRIRPCQIVQFRLSAQDLKNAAKEREATVTTYLLSRIFAAGRKATDRTEGEFSIQVPVNMRKFYPSETLRNFSLYCSVRIPVRDIDTADALIPEIRRQLNRKASKETMDEMVFASNQLTGKLRMIPLFLKVPVAGVIYGFLGDKIFSNTLSNLGVISLPPTLAEQIETMDFVLGTVISNRASCALVTVGNTATLTVSKNTIDATFEEALYDLFREDGIAVSVEGSDLYEG